MIYKRFNIYDYKKKSSKYNETYKYDINNKKKIPTITKDNSNKKVNIMRKIYFNPISDMEPVIKNENQFKKKQIKINPKAKERRIDVSNQKIYLYNDKYNKFKPTEYIYYPTGDLPKMGWIQYCIFCYNQT